ncbi:MAG: DUF134 domain-containing protein [Desulfobacterales bacterium]
MIELEEVRLTVDEREAVRLADLRGMSHEEAGRQMGVSRATFGRILQSARRTLADALINGKAINVEGGNFRIVTGPRHFRCIGCGFIWEEPKGTGRPETCPECKDDKFHRILENEAI